MSCKVCGTHEKRTAECTTTVDTQCEACLPGQYADKQSDPLQHTCKSCAGDPPRVPSQMWDHDKDPGTPCIYCTACGGGEVMLDNENHTCTALSDTQCTRCGRGKFAFKMQQQSQD